MIKKLMRLFELCVEEKRSEKSARGGEKLKVRMAEMSESVSLNSCNSRMQNKSS